ncbi:anti-sigma factor-like protein [Natranaerovirga pectinivora]|uniref:Anti-sigma factor-like protein n=1 Tax=Natranaerovirga pectinivora TaxID=682400 RepID=A0A4R3MNI8_9FIRM|nr:anti-sigma factor domain-containing protein [Natranaerovirga pectinivora]TCT16817.1 anti-sigma factor-like protein [Natranaerovirga pectinivora]
MKGIIMEISNNKAILLTEEGKFLKIRGKINNNYKIGNEVDTNCLKTNTGTKMVIRYSAVTLCLIFISLFIIRFLETPYGYINVEINPSIEVTYNYFGKIIEVKSLNEDGNRILENINHLKGEKVEKGISTIIIEAKNTGYIREENSNQIILTVIDKKNRINEERIIENTRQDTWEIKEIDIELLKGTMEDYNRAQKEGKSTSYIIMNDLSEEMNGKSIDDKSSVDVKQDIIKEKIEKNTREVNKKEVESRNQVNEDNNSNASQNGRLNSNTNGNANAKKVESENNMRYEEEEKIIGPHRAEEAIINRQVEDNKSIGNAKAKEALINNQKIGQEKSQGNNRANEAIQNNNKNRNKN